MEKYKFNPLKFVFCQIDDGDIYYAIIKDNKVVAKLFYINYGQGLKCEWHLKKVIHTFDPTQTNEETLFYDIPRENPFL